MTSWRKPPFGGCIEKIRLGSIIDFHHLNNRTMIILCDCVFMVLLRMLQVSPLYEHQKYGDVAR